MPRRRTITRPRLLVTALAVAALSAAQLTLVTGAQATPPATRDLLYSWGSSTSPGAISPAATNLSPVLANAGANASGDWSQVSGGHDHACGLDAAGVAYCWGSNAYGQLGIDAQSGSLTPVAVATTDTLPDTWTDISAGSDSFTCGISADHVAYCWGRSRFGQLGDGQTQDDWLIPEQVTSPASPFTGLWSSISAGSTYACALDSAGHAYCWGQGTSGQLGNNANLDSAVPVAVDTSSLGISTFTAISVGGGSACAIGSDDKAYCWGGGTSGELGNGASLTSNVPVAVVDGDNSAVGTAGRFLSISTGYAYACGVGFDHKAYCWGENSYGQLGIGNSTNQQVPMSVSVLGTDVQSLGTGAYSAATCAVTTTAAYCWGLGPNGQIGDGTTNGTQVPVPVNTPGLLAIATPVEISLSTAGVLMLASVETYTVTYDASGATSGTVPVDSSSPYITQSTVTVLANTGTLARTNCTFLGWNTAYNGTGTAYQPTNTFTIASDTTLFAQWTPFGCGPSGGGGGGGETPSPAPAPATTQAPESTTAEPTTPAPIADPLDPIGNSANAYVPASGIPAGEAVLLVGGQPVPVTVKPNSTAKPTSLEVEASGLTMNLQGRNSANAPTGLTSGDALVLQSPRPTRALAHQPDAKARRQPALLTKGSGFRPGSPVRFYVLPGTYVGQANADANGRYEIRLAMPAGLPAGVRTLQVNGFAPDGTVRSLSLGVLVKRAPALG